MPTTNKTVKEQILEQQAVGNGADPLWKKEFMELLNSKQKLSHLELRLCATITAFIRDKKL